MIARPPIKQTHLSEDTLHAFLHDELKDDTREVTQHIETCEQCQRQVEQLATSGWDDDDLGQLLRDRGPANRLAQENPTLPPSGRNDVDTDDFLTNANLKHSAGARPLSFLDEPTDGDSIGRFARYEIKEILGRGGMGIVMRALDTSLGRQCAVKVLSPELATSAAARKRFSREARSAAAVVHPHVVPIQTVDEHNGLPYLVMPVVEGQSLQQRVERGGPLSPLETVRIATQIAEGLTAAHEQGLIHRDIKPANILLENGVERVQITDFGLARAVDDASMTRSGVIAGTPQYMSPEQAHGDAMDHRSDLFSLGSVIYFMLTGRSPFRAETTMGVLNRIGNDAPRSLREINSDVPDWLESLVMRLLSKNPSHRYQQSADVAEVLKGWQAYLLDPTRSPPEPIKPIATSPTKLKGGGSFIGTRFPWILAAGMFGFFAWAAIVLVLQSDNGTLRIESHAEQDLPIQVRRGDKVVQEMTVTDDGQSIQVRSGEYTVEIAGQYDGIQIDNQQVKIERGDTHVVTITQETNDPIGPNQLSQNSRRQTKAVSEPPKISPFTKMVFEGGRVVVVSDDETFEVLEIERFPIDELIARTQRLYGQKWQKRLSEDLPEVLGNLEVEPKQSVRLKLRAIDTGDIEITEKMMTEANRRQLYIDNEHNQPEIAKRLEMSQHKRDSPTDSDLERTKSTLPLHWGGTTYGYRVTIDNDVKHEGDASASLEALNKERGMGFGTLVQAIRADRYSGKRLKYSGFLKTNDVRDAGLWMRIDSEERGTVAFDNMVSRRIQGTQDWQQVEIILDVPKDATIITFGAIMSNKGRLWADDLSLDMVDESVPATQPEMKPVKQEIQSPMGMADQPQNLDFEEGPGHTVFRGRNVRVFNQASDQFRLNRLPGNSRIRKMQDAVETYMSTLQPPSQSQPDNPQK
ncbi:serine/threonine protein kinase [Rhodopirellula sp. JC740]|uniref:Serine/threonine protein kinase n=1 Tax=Rhodopirellula halodulae TaxID=2894198 RepID=A0ABS8NH77_9BACT|nr:serine/threonine-protein kinase [Rhodopirellula sp. JC740]MCC9642900.1 serine/threonine protein kinase [Rhodopirellula sp. JC740]